MKVHVILLCYAIDVTPLIESVDGSDVIWHIFMHSRRREMVEPLKNSSVIARIYDEHRMWMYDYGFNRGLGASCNKGVIDAISHCTDTDTIIIPNDDLVWTRADFDRLVQGCVDHRDAGLIFCNGYQSGMLQDLNFGCFGINPIALETVGYFDESFPDYFCDRDMLRRCELLGVKIHSIGDTDIIHQGSGTLNAVPAIAEQVQRTFPLDNAHYISKHGGTNSQEKFLHPFNDASLSWRIPAEDRHDPYPGHRRAEEELRR